MLRGSLPLAFVSARRVEKENLEADPELDRDLTVQTVEVTDPILGKLFKSKHGDRWLDKNGYLSSLYGKIDEEACLKLPGVEESREDFRSSIADSVADSTSVMASAIQSVVPKGVFDTAHIPSNVQFAKKPTEDQTDYKIGRFADFDSIFFDDVELSKKCEETLQYIDDSVDFKDWFRTVNLYTDTFRKVPRATAAELYRRCWVDRKEDQDAWMVLEDYSKHYDALLIPIMVSLYSPRTIGDNCTSGPWWCSFLSWEGLDHIRSFLWGNLIFNYDLLGKPRKGYLKEFRTYFIGHSPEGYRPECPRGLEIYQWLCDLVASFFPLRKEALQRLAVLTYGRTSGLPSRRQRIKELHDALDVRNQEPTDVELLAVPVVLETWTGYMENSKVFSHMEGSWKKSSQRGIIAGSNKGSYDFSRSMSGKNGYLSLVIKFVLEEYKGYGLGDKFKDDDREWEHKTITVFNLETGSMEDVPALSVSFGERIFHSILKEVLEDVCAEIGMDIQQLPTLIEHMIRQGVANKGHVFVTLIVKVLDLPELGAKCRIPTERRAAVSMLLLAFMNPLWAILETSGVFSDISRGNPAWECASRRDMSDRESEFPNTTFMSDLKVSTDSPFKGIFDGLLEWFVQWTGYPRFASQIVRFMLFAQHEMHAEFPDGSSRITIPKRGGHMGDGGVKLCLSLMNFCIGEGVVESMRENVKYLRFHPLDRSVTGDDLLLGIYFPPEVLHDIAGRKGGFLKLARKAASDAVYGSGAVLSTNDTALSKDFAHYCECLARFPFSYLDTRDMSRYATGSYDCFLDFPSPKLLIDLITQEGAEEFEDHRKARSLELAQRLRQVVSNCDAPLVRWFAFASLIQDCVFHYPLYSFLPERYGGAGKIMFGPRHLDNFLSQRGRPKPKAFYANMFNVLDQLMLPDFEERNKVSARKVFREKNFGAVPLDEVTASFRAWDQFLSSFKNLKAIGFHMSAFDLEMNATELLIKRSPKFRNHIAYTAEEQRHNRVDLRNIDKTGLGISLRDLATRILVIDNLSKELGFGQIKNSVDEYIIEPPPFPTIKNFIATESVGGVQIHQLTINHVGGATRYQQGSYLTDIYDTSALRRVEIFERMFSFGFGSPSPPFEEFPEFLEERTIESWLSLNFANLPSTEEEENERNKLDYLYLPHFAFEDDSLISLKLKVARRVFKPKDGGKVERSGRIAVLSNDKAVLKDACNRFRRPDQNILFNRRTLNEVYLARDPEECVTLFGDEASGSHAMSIYFDEVDSSMKEIDPHSGDIEEYIFLDTGNFQGLSTRFYRGVDVQYQYNDVFQAMLSSSRIRQYAGRSPVAQSPFWEAAQPWDVVDSSALGFALACESGSLVEDHQELGRLALGLSALTGAMPGARSGAVGDGFHPDNAPLSPSMVTRGYDELASRGDEWLSFATKHIQSTLTKKE